MDGPNMKTLSFQRLILSAAISLALGSAQAATFDLCAKAGTKTMADGTVVPVWGYAPTCADPVQVPGPALVVPPGDTTLTINLTNELPVPTSIIVNGLQFDGTPAPVFFADGTPQSDGVSPSMRVRSLVHETDLGSPGNGTLGSYTYKVKPGTYLYQSGTEMQWQTPMGLYGAVTQDDGVAGQVYGVAYDHEATLLYSEVDPALNNAVSTGNYSTGADVNTGGMTSTIGFKPRYYLVNGESYTPGQLPLDAGLAGQTTLLRMLNAGNMPRTAVLQGLRMEIVATNGSAYHEPRDQYSAYLGTKVTKDAVLQLPLGAQGTYAVYDGNMGSANVGQLDTGGNLAFLGVQPALPKARAIDKLDIGGAPAVAVLIEDGATLMYTAHFKNAQTGADAGVGSVALASMSDTLVDFDTIPGAAPMVAALVQTSAGDLRAVVVNAQDGSAVATINYPSGVTPYGLAGTPEGYVAALYKNPNGSVHAQVKDLTDTAVVTINYGNLNTPAGGHLGFKSLADIPGSFSTMSELAVLSTTNSNATVRVEIRDIGTAVSADNLFTFINYGNLFVPYDFGFLPDTGFVPEKEGVAVAGVYNNRAYVYRKTLDRDSLNPSITYGAGNTPVQMSVISDSDASGHAEIVILGEWTDGNVRLQTRDPVSRTFLTAQVLDAGFDAIGMVDFEDFTGNGAVEMAVLTENPDTGAIRVQRRDVASGAANSPNHLDIDF